MKLRLSNSIKITATFIVIAAVTYGFLCVVNWSYNLGDWNGFSRFIFAFIGVLYLLKILSEEF